jgi:cytidylate kinase
MKEITVNAEWHEDAKVWVATSNDIWGLAAQAANLESLRAKVLPMIADLVELNNIAVEGQDVSVHIVANLTATLRLKSVA